MAGPPHLVSVDKYLVFHNEAQRTTVHYRNVKTVYDLFSAVWFDSDRLPRDPSRMYVLKGRLLGFLNAACRKTFIDLQGYTSTHRHNRRSVHARRVTTRSSAIIRVHGAYAHACPSTDLMRKHSNDGGAAAQ